MEGLALSALLWLWGILIGAHTALEAGDEGWACCIQGDIVGVVEDEPVVQASDWECGRIWAHKLPGRLGYGCPLLEL